MEWTTLPDGDEEQGAPPQAGERAAEEEVGEEARRDDLEVTQNLKRRLHVYSRGCLSNILDVFIIILVYIELIAVRRVVLNGECIK